MAQDVRPLRGRVAIRPLVPTHFGVLVLPDTAADTERTRQQSSGVRAQSSHRGRVLAMGPYALTPKGGATVTAGFAVGDEVVYVFGRNGTEVSRTGTWSDGKPVVWVSQEEVVAVFDWTCEACETDCRCLECGAPCTSQCVPTCSEQWA